MQKNEDQVMKAYYREWGTRRTQDKLRDRIHWILNQISGKKVLDVGCSQGLVPLLLGRAGYEVLGLDVFAGAIETANTHLAKESDAVQERVRFALEDVHTFDSDERFDSAIAGEVLEHMVDPGRTVAAIHGFLHDGGKLVVTVPFGVHPDNDHKQTYYLSDMLRLLEPDFAVEQLHVTHKFICCVAQKMGPVTSPRPEDEKRYADLLKVSERAFCGIEQNYQADAEELRALVRHHASQIEAGDRDFQKIAADAVDRVSRALVEVERYKSEVERAEDHARLARAEVEQLREVGRQAQESFDSAQALNKTVEIRSQKLYEQLRRARGSVGFRVGRASSVAFGEGDPLHLPQRWIELFGGADEVLTRLAPNEPPHVSPVARNAVSASRDPQPSVSKKDTKAGGARWIVRAATNLVSPRKRAVPRDLLSHRMLPLVTMAAQRPVVLPAMQEKIRDLWHPGIGEELAFVLQALSEDADWRKDAANLFVASVRALCEADLDLGLEFASRYLNRFPDPRAIRSLVTFHRRAGNDVQALGMLELMEPSDWVETTRARLRRSPPKSSKPSPDRHFLTHEGYKLLLEDSEPAVLLYGDINMNVIDGSSVWLASVAEALLRSGVNVHFLLKADIERSVLLEPLLERPGLSLIEPTMLGHQVLSPAEAVDAIEALDGLYGGYRAIILRGMDVCDHAADRKSLWKRVWAYLTDFYRHDFQAGGKLVVDQEVRDSFGDLRCLFELFLVQTHQIADYLVQELGISRAQALQLPPMIPDPIGDRGAEPEKDRQEGPFRVGYAGKVAPAWGVLELIACGEDLAARGHAVEVHVIGDKIHRSTSEHPNFAREARHALETSKIVHWHHGLSRAETMERMSQMDLGWCYRDPALERNTLELSTKLLECMAISLPVVVTKNAINAELLGAEYPHFVKEPGDHVRVLEEAIEARRFVDFRAPEYRAKVEAHSISHVGKTVLAPALDLGWDNERKRIVIAGHDLKFIAEFESHLKRLGHVVKRDHWQWGRPGNNLRTQYLCKWADVVFCEWALANAVWYARNLDPRKRLVIRLHSQEVHKRAKVFPRKIDIENVDAVVFVADEIKRKAIQDFEWSTEHLVTIPNFVNTEVFERAKSSRARYRIGMLGIVPQMKRFDRALDLISELRAQDARFELVIKGSLPRDLTWMAGRQDEKVYYDAQFERLKNDPILDQGVSFDGFSPRLAQWYRDIGYVLSPSDFESFHYSIAEGAASGAMPVVWPWHGAEKLYPGEWIVDGTAAAKERILTLAQASDEEWTELGRSGMEIIRSRYGMEQIFERLAAVVLGDD